MTTLKDIIMDAYIDTQSENLTHDEAIDLIHAEVVDYLKKLIEN